MTVVAVKSTPGSGRDMIDLSTPHPHPTIGAQFGFAWETYGSQPWPSWFAVDYAQMWRTQPSLRKVVDFLARNIAQVRCYLYRRVSDTDRERIADHPLARALQAPHPSQSWYRFVEALVTELCIFDRAFAVELQHDAGELWLRQIPASWAWFDFDQQQQERVLHVKALGLEAQYPADRVFELAGYNPNPPMRCPPCETLRQILAEDSAATDYRADLWRNGARMSGWIERPAEAPEWSDGARERFRREWHGRWSSGSEEAGGTPVLEEGMKFTTATATAEQSQYVEARKLTLAEVASAYQIPPPMVGLLDNANYSNVREFHKALYSDTLGPIIASIEDRLNAFLVPLFGDAPEYVEFNIAEKLQGSFEAQAAALQTAVGAPWMLRSEARAIVNLPFVEGTDELVVPLNVGESSGAAASSPSPPSAASDPHAVLRTAAARPQLAIVRLKASVTEAQQQKVEDVLTRYFTRQQQVVMSRIGGGDSDFWDAKRWDALLQDDLASVAAELTTVIGKSEAERLGYRASDYDAAQTLDYIASVAERYAGNVNATTKQQLDDELDKPADESDPSHVFDVAIDSRAAGIAVGYATFAAGFASSEAGRQIANTYDVKPTKTWITGPNPRPSHAQMNGETVGVDEAFSNGMQWPAESGDVDEVAGCNCSVEVTIG